MNWLTKSYPYWIAKGNTPIALHTENLPPTKSQNPNTLSSEIPKALVAGILVEQALYNNINNDINNNDDKNDNGYLP